MHMLLLSSNQTAQKELLLMDVAQGSSETVLI